MVAPSGGGRGSKEHSLKIAASDGLYIPVYLYLVGFHDSSWELVTNVRVNWEPK